MPREVFSEKDTPILCSTPSAPTAEISLESLIRMTQRHPRAQQNGKLARSTAHIACPDGKDGVARTSGPTSKTAVGEGPAPGQAPTG